MSTHLHIIEKTAKVDAEGNNETLYTSNKGVIYYDPSGASRTGVILEAGQEDGQSVTVVNTADAAEVVTFAADATSNVQGGTSVSISRAEARSFKWSSALSRWLVDNKDAAGMQYVDVAVDATEAALWDNTPQTYVPAVAGSVILVDSVYVFLDYVDTAFTLDTADIQLGYSGGSTIITPLIANANFTGEADYKHHVRDISYVPVENEGVVVKTSTGDAIGGGTNTTIYLRIYYKVVPSALS